MRIHKSSALVNGMTLAVRKDQSVYCPQRGDVTLETCVGCPMLVSAHTRRGKLKVCCRLQGTLAFGPELDTASRLTMTRAGATSRPWGY